VFREDEFSQLTGREPGSGASQVALNRLSRSGQITLAQKKPARWLIVPPEQAHFGAPPVDWWLDELMQEQEPSYYLALLSAARYWGSAHYAHQSAQVMLSRPRRPMTAGKLRVEFFVKKNLAGTPAVRERTATAHVRVSTREATLLDLIRHQAAVGGLEAIARIARDFAPRLSSRGLIDALEALDQVPAAQRLGFVLDQLGQNRLANTVSAYLSHSRRNIQPLETPRDPGATMVMVDGKWAIEYTSRQDAVLQEVKG
jgi:hypothetical protein